MEWVVNTAFHDLFQRPAKLFWKVNMADNDVSCCTPRRSQTTPADPMPTTHRPDRHGIEQCLIPSGVFAMGDATGDGRPGDGETPVHQVALSALQIDATSVTNDDFSAFVQDTGYRTDAQRFGSSAVFHLMVAAAEADVLGSSPRIPWWIDVRGADWAHPEGPRSDLSERGDHPVVHVSWNDAQAYCRWADRRLPTEAEWERASRGGIEGARYPWGNDLMDGAAWRTNIWQGSFPTINTAADGWLSTAPVRSYQPNGFGLWQTVGNVWEWCQDTYDPRAYAARAGRDDVQNPLTDNGSGVRVLRGGSFLCHDSYCNRYRNSARSSNTADSSMSNAGFRTAAAVGDPA